MMMTTVPVLRELPELRMASEWYAHPASEIWRKQLYSKTKQNIIEAFCKATSEETRCQLQGALCLLEALNDNLSRARDMLDKVELRQKQGVIERGV